MEHKPGAIYGISFNTSAVKKTRHITYIGIQIVEDTMDMQDTIRVDLIDHPQYKVLEQYVLSNAKKRK